MSNKERVRLALSRGCSVRISVKDFPPSELVEFAHIAAASSAGVTITFRDCFEKAPQVLDELTKIGAAKPGAFIFEY